MIGRHLSELSGYAAGMLTPFDDVGNIDFAAFEQFCHRQIQELREDGEAAAPMPCFAVGLCGTMDLACKQGQIAKAQRRAAFGV